jgi:hypothetical protein
MIEPEAEEQTEKVCHVIELPVEPALSAMRIKERDSSL